MNRWVLLVTLIAAGIWLAGPSEVDPGPGAVAPEMPSQRAADDTGTIEQDGYRITPLAEFELRARVLAREDYWLGRESDLSPTDLALGWGQMSDSAVIEQLDISQSGRWYFWRAKQMPLPRRAIETQSANMHMIPADGVVARELSNVRKGDIVNLTGKLVRVEADDGWRWISSLTRHDTGARSCELVWIEELEIE